MKTLFSLAIVFFAIGIIMPFASASESDEKLDFAVALEETLGHLAALEQNLDEKNYELAQIHATHPISELYSVLKPELHEYDAILDDQINKSLMDLAKNTGSKVSRQDAQKAIDEARSLIEKARTTVIGEKMSSDIEFKLRIIQALIHTSEVEYEEAVSMGEIHEMAEFQDGSSFVTRSKIIFEGIVDQLPEHEAEEIEEFFEDLETSMQNKVEPENVEVLFDGIIHEIDEILGEETEEEDLLEYVANIESLLNDVKKEYKAGNKDLALSLATKAYLDNYEFLEGPLVEAGQEELMEEVEIMLREDLRAMIKENRPSEEINNQVDSILQKMDDVAVAVPEFGTIAILVMSIGLMSILVLSKRNLLPLRN